RSAHCSQNAPASARRLDRGGGCSSARARADRGARATRAPLRGPSRRSARAHARGSRSSRHLRCARAAPSSATDRERSRAWGERYGILAPRQLGAPARRSALVAEPDWEYVPMLAEAGELLEKAIAAHGRRALW